MVKYHISPETGRPNICRAQVGQCPLKDEDGNTTPHFGNKDEARVYHEKTLNDKYGSFSTKIKKVNKTVLTDDPRTVIHNGRKMSDSQAFLKNSVKELANKVVEARAGYGSIADDYDPAKAQKRLSEAIEFADSRHDTHLVKKLSSAKVIPGETFAKADGSTFKTDDMLDNQIAVKHITEGREKLVNALTVLANNGHVKLGTFKAENEAGKYSVAVKDGGFDEDAFNKLPSNVREAISSPKESLDINLVREKISAEKRARIMSSTQTISYVIGKPHDVGQDSVIADTRFDGADDNEKFQNGVNNIAKFYGDAQDNIGSSMKDLKSRSTEMTNAMKSAVAGEGENVFLPGRARSNGALISMRENLAPAKAKEVLSEDELRSVTVSKPVPDAEKARKILPPAVFDAIFNNRVVSLRVS